MLKVELVTEFVCVCVCVVVLIVNENLKRKKERIECTKKKGYIRKRAEYSMDMLALIKRRKKEKGNQNV